MTTNEKKYPVTGEIADLFIESKAAADCRDKAVMGIWRTRKAIRYGEIKISTEQEAWRLIYELYPNLSKKTLQYDPIAMELVIEE